MDGCSVGGSSSSEYINNVICAIKDWKSEAPGVVSAALGYLVSPVIWLTEALIPVKAIEGLLNGLDWCMKNTLSQRSSQNPEELRYCDQAADAVINWHVAGGALEGGAAGFFGLFSLPADIPAVIALALRTIRQVGVEYGYEDDTEKERLFVLSVLRASGANSQAEKAEALVALRLLLVALQKQTWTAMAGKAATHAVSLEAAIIAVRALAKQLGVNLTKRKALAAVPGIGAVVGASVNGWYIREVGVAAQYLYQERWLRDRGLLIDPEIRQTE